MVRGGDRLALIQENGAVLEVPGPGGQIAAASIANGRIVAQTAGPSFQVAAVDPAASADPVWRRVEVDVPDDLFAAPVVSPDGTQLALAGGRIGGDLPIRVIVLDLASGSTREIEIDREPDGQLVWLDSSTLLLEVIPNRGARFVRLDLLTHEVSPTLGEGYGPAISGDGASVAVAREALVVQSTVEWLAGADGGERVSAVSNPIRSTLDGPANRLAVLEGDDDGVPRALSVLERRPDGWTVVWTDREPPEWFGWLR